MKKLIFIIWILFCNTISYSQSIGINESGIAPHPSALLDIKSTAKGLLIPRMSTAQRKAIPGPAAGLLVFDLDKSTIYLFDGEKWQAMLFSNSGANNPPIGRSASDGSASDRFGISVSISGDYAIVGANLDDNGAKTDQGAAYIFMRQGGTWSEQSKLTASDGGAGDNFGNSVGISGDYAIVGSPRGAGNWFLQGAAYIFVRTGSTWTQQAKLNASDGLIGDYFGTSVSISGADVLVGAPNDSDPFANMGSAYVFVRTGAGWSQQSKLTVSYGKYNDRFGFSVSINGDYAIVGAPFTSINIAYPYDGSAYIFVRSGVTWALQVDLYRADGFQDDNFGYSVSISGDYAIVGEPGEYAAPYTHNGAAYIYKRNGTSWSLPIKLTAADSEAESYFGNSVCISGDYAIIGKYYDAAGSNPYQGSAYIYRRSASAWTLERKVDDGSGQNPGLFGSAVGVSGYNYIIGAVGKNSSKGEVSFLNIE
ncbi:MAG: FG-GAP repeat protein [Ferruginibacter sp.]